MQFMRHGIKTIYTTINAINSQFYLEKPHIHTVIKKNVKQSNLIIKN